MIERTEAEQAALDRLKGELFPLAEDFLHEVMLALAGLPEDEADHELRRLGHVLFRAMQDMFPDLPEAVQLGLPFAFTELARERIRLMARSGLA